MNIQDEHARVKDAKTVLRALTKKASEMQEVTPYRTMKCGAPPIRLSPLRKKDADLESLITNIFSYVNASDMADYSKDFLSMIDALMQNVHAVHICSWDEYVSSLRAMLPWMVAYDNNRYGRWLLDFWAMLTTLPTDQVALTSLSP